MIIDAGPLLALETKSGHRRLTALVEALIADDIRPVTNRAALAQVWRDPQRQVPLARILRYLEVREFGDEVQVGRRCAASGTSDVVDASLAVLADELGATVLTTDPEDFERLGVIVEPF